MPDEPLHIQLFGDFYLRLGDRPLPALPPQEQSLLAYLLLHRDTPQSRQHLAYLLWPDSTDAQARGQLRKLFYRLRQDLPDADVYLQADTQTVGWRPEAPFTLDVAEFEGALDRAARALDAAGQEMEAGRRDAARHDAACDALERAAALYRGDLLPACYDDWIAPERTRLLLNHLHALEQLVDLLEGSRQYDRAIGYAQRLLRHDPLHEPGYRALMRLHALTGNRAAALRAYYTCATTLQRELDVDPGPDTQQVYQRLLQAGGLEAGALAAAPQPAGASPIAVSMVGRHAEWEQLTAAWHEAMENGPPASQVRLALIEGEAGIGKTRLAEEFARWARWQGAATAAARCYAAEGGLAYAPVVQWLRARPLPPLEPVWRRELSRLLPELLDPEELGPGELGIAPRTEPWQRQRLFQALARAVVGSPPHVAGTGHIPAGPQPLLLFLDDLQWCDRETLEWLHYLLRSQPTRLLLLATVRVEEVGEAHPLHDWLRSVRRAANAGTAFAQIALGPLDEAETQALAASASGTALDPGLAACIYGETEGNPLFVIEVVRAGRLSGESEPACPPQGLPPRVQATIEGRLARLSPAARDLAGLAATVGREFTYAVLEAACDLDADALLRALDELWQRRVVREVAEAGPASGSAGYDFSHDKLREVAYAGLSAARRQVLHRRVAGALEALHAGDLDPGRLESVAGQIAAHYERGGQAARAIPYHLRAAEHARRVYANEEAAGHYERALALLPAVSQQPAAALSRETEQRFEAHSGLGQIYLRLGQPAEAEAHLGQAIALGRQAIALDRPAIALGRDVAPSPHQLAWLYIWLGQALYAQSKLAEQIRIGEEGLALLGEEINPAEAALILGATALGYPHQDDQEQTREIWRRAAAYVEDRPYVEEWGAIYPRVFTSYLRDKQADEARRWLHILESKIASLADERAWGILHQRTQDLLIQEGDLQGGTQHLQQAVTHAARSGNVLDQSMYLWQLGFRSVAIGDLGAADRHARAAFELQRAIGGAFFLAWGHWLLGLIAACRGSEREAQEHLEQALPHTREADRPAIAVLCHCILGRMHLNRGERERALERYRLAAEICTPDLFRRWHAPEIWSYARVFGGVLSGLEESSADAEAFREACRRFPGRESMARSGDLDQLALEQWFLAPAAPSRPARLTLDEPLSGLHQDGTLSSGGPQAAAWAWRDPYGDCRYALEGGLAVEAANGRDLWLLNHSAPRLLRPLSSLCCAAPGLDAPENARAPVPGASSPAGAAIEAICAPENARAPVPGAPSPAGAAIEAICTPVSEDKPAMGGLLIWIDRANYLRLDWGMGGPREITLTGCIENRDAVYGRGRLPPRSAGGADLPLERVWLRLEWAAPGARALCSADGQAWFTAGSVTLPYDARAEVGVYACGNIDRSLYHGAYPEGTAIRFESFRAYILSPPTAPN